MPRSNPAPLRVAIVLVTVCALAFPGCGSSDDTSSTPTATTAKRPDLEQKVERGAKKNEDAKIPKQEGRAPSKGKRGGDTSDTSAPQATAKSAQPQDQGVQPSPPAQSKQQPKRQVKPGKSGVAAAGCPQGLSGNECKSAAEAVTQAPPAEPESSSASCPAGLSQAECEAAAKATQGAAPKAPSDPAQCPPGLSPTECREAGEALGY